MPNAVGVDIEVEDDKVWCVGLSTADRRTASKNGDAMLDRLDGDWPVFHNAKFDLEYLDPDGSKYGTDFYDSLMESHFLGYRDLNLPYLTCIFLTGTPLDKTVIKERKTRRFDERADTVLDVCSMDAWASHALHVRNEQAMAPYQALYEKERKITRVLMSMERTGLPLAQDKVKLAMAMVTRKMGSAEVKLRAMGVTEPGNTEYIGQKFWRGKKKIRTTKTGLMSTTADDLRECKGPNDVWVETLIEWRQMNKFRSTYLKNWMRQDFLHPSMWQWLATWRFSCRDPNLQNVAKSKDVPLYRLFEAPPGWVFISADYSQIELRVLANIADVKAMKQVYLNDGDLHDNTVQNVPYFRAQHDTGDPFYQDKARTAAKTVNFGIPYKITPYGLAPKVKDTEEAAGQMIEGWYESYPEVGPWQDSQLQFCRDNGYVLTMEGRPLWIPGIYAAGGGIAGHADKQTSNYSVQGGAAEVVKNAMIRCPEYLVMQVHDELLYLVPENRATEYMEHLKVALVDTSDEVPYTIGIKMGKTWGDIKNMPESPWESDDDDDE